MTKYFLLSALAAVLLSSCKSSNKQESEAVQPAKAPPHIVGLWKSPNPEFAGNGQYAIREFNISMGRWDHTLTLAADKNMTKTIFVYRVEGSYSFEQASEKLQGAYNLQFKPNKKYLTLKTKEKLILEDLGFKECKLLQNKEKDISDSGCATIKSLAECPTEFDIVKFESDQLFLGERPIDNEVCSPEHRPESFASGLKKMN